MARAQEASGAEASVAASSRPAGKHAARQVRAQGAVPAVLYGHGEPLALALAAREALAIERMPRNHVFTLRPDGGEAENVRLVAVQRTPTSGEVLHLDLERVVRGGRSRVAVPVTFHGEEDLARREGVVARLVDLVEVEGETMHLPAALSVDLSALAPGDHLWARDLALPAGVTLVTPGETAIAQVGHAHATGADEAPVAEAESAQERPEADSERS